MPKNIITHFVRKKIGLPVILNYAKKIEDAAFNPYPYQAIALKNIIKSNRKTEFAAVSGLSKVDNMEKARYLPVYNYEMLRPEFEKVFFAGKKGFFSLEPIKAISLTSGTSGGPKYIPILLKV